MLGLCKDLASIMLFSMVTERIDIYDAATGFVNQTHPNKVHLLHTSFYGLKQSPQAWYEKLSGFIGFSISSSDSSWFYWKNNGECVFVLVYVNNIIITGSRKGYITILIEKLIHQFHLKDMKDLKFFLGMEFTRSTISGSYFLSQQRYINDLLRCTNMNTCKLVLTSRISTTKLNSTEEITLTHIEKYS